MQGFLRGGESGSAGTPQGCWGPPELMLLVGARQVFGLSGLSAGFGRIKVGHVTAHHLLRIIKSGVVLAEEPPSAGASQCVVPTFR